MKYLLLCFFLLGCAQNQRILASNQTDARAKIYLDLSDQVVQNQIFADAYSLNPRRNDLTGVASDAYNEYQRDYKGVLEATISTAMAVGGSIGLMQSIPPQQRSFKLTTMAFYSAGVGSLSLYRVNAGRGIDQRLKQSRRMQDSNAAIINLDDQELDQAVRDHSEIVGHFLALQPPELGRFRSRLKDKVVQSSRSGDTVDSIELLLAMGLIDGRLGKAALRWRDLARESMGSHVRLNEERTRRAELNHLAWTSSMIKAYLASAEGEKLTPAVRKRLQTVVSNSDQTLARAVLLER